MTRIGPSQQGGDGRATTKRRDRDPLGATVVQGASSNRVRTRSRRMIHDGASSGRGTAPRAGRAALADGRDVAATGRDTTAHLRDLQADDRDQRAGRYVDDLHDRLTRIERQLLARLARPENIAVDPADRAGISKLIDDLRTAIGDSRVDGINAARDRHAAGHDRQAAAQDRIDAAHVRDESGGDRDQADIERQQSDLAGPTDTTPVTDRPDGLDDSLPQRVARAVRDSRRRITGGRAYLTRRDGPVRPVTASPPDTDG